MRVAMLVVGLTGGIGSGKSTFASLLAERGAQIIDADLLGRDALKPGEPGWHEVVETFGDEILTPYSMEIDRARLAEIVFGDKAKLAALNAIVHPIILGKIADGLDRLRNSDAVVILDAALIVELGLAESVDLIIVVTASEATRKKRLVTRRGMTEADVLARMGSQASEDELLAAADVVVRNDGAIEDLVDRADEVWKDLVARAPR
ncbi:MAG TPA: dephospho-CoA kinase [Actinomycetota bacterium]|nr:dephospho-CoA kinase [Actinomycetota bacterium]